VTVDDPVILRTMTSMEYVMLDLYQWITDQGALDEQATALIGRFVEDHQAAADALAERTTEIGGEPYECANDWYTRRVLPPIEAAVTGDDAAGIPPSPEPATDLLRISYGFETVMSSSYQKMIELLKAPELRPQLAELGAQDARHSAAVAMLATGTPEGYISPVVLGAEETPNEQGADTLYAIPARFGSLTATEITIGAPNEEGTQAGFAVETPADNAYVYNDQTCPA
jgi:hypothetical protein